MNDKLKASKGYQLFLEFCKIPHASFKTESMRRWIKDFAHARSIDYQEDKAGNILLTKGLPRVCLQAHYDMVLVGEVVEPYVDGEYLRSRSSSLGADNGAALCVGLSLFDVVEDLEMLLTNDEEVGMIGANHLELKPKAQRILNLDSEDIDEIIIGCAGGVDVVLTFEHAPLLESEERLNVYKIISKGFKGGHSGVDIDKGIPNAIVAMVDFIQDQEEAYLLSLKGGEKRNSIPSFSEAVVLSRSPILSTECFEVKPFVLDPPYRDLSKVLEFIKIPFLNAVLQKDSEGRVCLSSNIGVVSEESFQTIVVQVMARANITEELEKWIEQVEKYARGYGVKIETHHFYPAWEGVDQGLLQIVQQSFKKFGLSPRVTTIHAGLECGILKNTLGIEEILSIGPSIEYPHSKNERLHLASFMQFEEILKDIVRNL